MSVTIWHNPRCSKSRAALALVAERAPDHVVRFYLKDAPTAAELRDVLKRLGIGAHDLMRTGEKLYRDLDLSAEMDDAALIAAMEAHPILIERPIVFVNGEAAIGRPPENVLSLF